MGAVTVAGLVDTLTSDGPFTVFAPSDAAFAAVPAETLNAILGDPAAITEVLLYHVVPGLYLSTDLFEGQQLKTVDGDDVTIHVGNGNVAVNTANVLEADLIASNGVIHIIDAVLAQPADSGVGTIIPFLGYTTLATALDAANLTETLNSAGPFTLFAPNNAAFDKLPAGALTGLLNDTAALTDLLLAHVVPDTVFSTGLVDGTALTTLAGSNISVAVVNASILLDGVASIVIPDVLAANGIIHGITHVLTV